MRKGISRKARKIIAVLSAAVLTLTAVIGGANIYFTVLGKQEQHGSVTGQEWSPESSFRLSDLQEIDMGDKEFKTLVITDVHLKNHATFAAFLGVNYILDWAGKSALDRMVEKVQPDLILVLGDTVLTNRNDLETERFVRQMDGYQVAWACVFGNHDDEGRADKAKLAEVLLKSQNGLFQYGPADLHGIGNYALRLTRQGKTQQIFFMMDSGSSREFPDKTDGINEKQVAWYQWNLKGIAAAEGTVPDNMAFFHIPLPVYSEMSTFQQGERGEATCPGNTDAGLFDAMKQYRGTHIFVGHDHNNNFIVEKEGMKLGYAMKSSYNCYFKSGMTGGTLLTIHPDNQVSEELIYFGTVK